MEINLKIIILNNQEYILHILYYYIPSLAFGNSNIR